MQVGTQLWMNLLVLVGLNCLFGTDIVELVWDLRAVASSSGLIII